MRNSFLGIYASNRLPTLPEPITKPFGIICNTAPSGQPGKHWCLIWCSYDVILFVDPLQKSPLKNSKHIFEWLLKNKKQKKVIQLKYAIQDKDNSNLCGLFVLYFLYHLSHGAKSLHSIARHFDSKHLEHNDRLLANFFWDKFRFYVSLYRHM